MELIIAGSSSEGNGYLIKNASETIAVEAGMPFMAMKKALDFDTRSIAACLISHEHGDHAKYAHEYAIAGIPIYASEGTHEAIYTPRHAAKYLEPSKPIKVGRFTIVGFNVKHDAAEPMGFLIHHPDSGKILFATDTASIPYEFNGLNQIMIEANYSEAITYERVMSGSLNARHQDRVEQSHMSIENTLRFLERIDTSETSNIVLLHLSAGNSNARDFKRQVERATGKMVTIADKGVKINFSKTPF